MERLTFDGNFCDIAQCKDAPGGSFCEDGTCRLKELWERLKAYEDTGLSPEKVSWMKEVVEAAFDNDTSRIERAHNLHVADKEGRVLVLPCKPGTEVWVTRHDKVWPMSFVAPTLSAVCPDMSVHCQKDTCAGGLCKAYFGTDARDFGKTVFLSREEAEKALQEMEGRS